MLTVARYLHDRGARGVSNHVGMVAGALGALATGVAGAQGAAATGLQGAAGTVTQEAAPSGSQQDPLAEVVVTGSYGYLSSLADPYGRQSYIRLDARF